MPRDSDTNTRRAPKGFYYDQNGNLRVTPKPGDNPRDLQTRTYGPAPKQTGQSGGGSGGGHSVGSFPSAPAIQAPAFPAPPSLPPLITIPDPDNARIRAAEERNLARRKRGRASTILSDSPNNQLN